MLKNLFEKRKCFTFIYIRNNLGMSATDLQSEKEYKFQVIVSMHFQKKMEIIQDRSFKKSVYNALNMLAKGFDGWQHLGVKSVNFAKTSYPLRSVKINREMGLLFEGPIPSKRFGSVLFVHDIFMENELAQLITRIITLGEESRVFSKPIPAKALLDPEVMDDILSTEKANLLLTRKQLDVLYADSPILIHGHAGSGKTTILCHRLALSVLSHRNNPNAKFVFVSYNDRLVKQAFKDTLEILRYLYFAEDTLDKVTFTTFRNFLKRYVPNPNLFEEFRYVPFGRFKHFYEKFKWGSASGRRIPAEVAWHAIRSILKGACKPPLRPPLSIDEYRKLARRRREFPEDIFDDIYKIGEWYQKEIIHDKRLWDDQDLAWEALNWIWKEKERNPNMELYDEIFCDEVQDLTEIEFLLLVALCKRPKATGLPLVLSGDPLQTINPTGFRWSIVSSEVFRVQGKPVTLHELEENFRSDEKIVSFANRIQEVRSRYLGHSVKLQNAFEKGGEIPQVFLIEGGDEISIIKNKLGELPPESAIIIWLEEKDDVDSYVSSEEPLSRIDRKLDLYTIQEAKGLEFRIVILYKFGSSSEALKWKNYLSDWRQPTIKDEIPLLYFLNRLYVAVTRAKLFLLIIDTKQGIDNLWSVWNESLYFVPRDKVREMLENHPAFLAEISPTAWYRWAEVLFDHAEETRDIRLYERAKRAFEKAHEIQKAKLVDARIAEINEEYEKAATIYTELNNFEKAGCCYEKALMWREAYEAYAKLPTTPENKRRVAICKFKKDVIENPTQASMEFYKYIIEDENVELKYINELADTLLRIENYELAAQVFLNMFRRFNDKECLKRAAQLFFKAKNFGMTEQLLAEAGETKSPEYELSRAENLLEKNGWHEAAELFFKNNAYDKVIETYERAKLKGAFLSKELIELAAKSYFNLQRWGKAYATYEMLISATRVEDVEILKTMAECLEKLDEKGKAMELYYRAGLYKKAGELAEKLNLPKEEVLKLKIEGARREGDFNSAINFAIELGDEKLVHTLKGHALKHRSEYREAVEEFILAEEWVEALNCLIKGEFTYTEQYDKICDIIKAVVFSKKELSQEEKERIMGIVRQVQSDPIWETRISPRDMGLIYEKCATSIEAIYYYESHINEKWSQEGWIRVKLAQCNYYRRRGYYNQADEVYREIQNRKKI